MTGAATGPLRGRSGRSPRPKGPLLYHGFDLTIDPGRLVALMGPSGCGKSTLAKLLLGFYPPTAGTIRIDGVDLRHLAANERRATFGVVPQETVLFSGTVRANLIAGNPMARFAQIVQACKRAGIHDVIEALPLGYETEVGARRSGRPVRIRPSWLHGTPCT